MVRLKTMECSCMSRVQPAKRCFTLFIFRQPDTEPTVKCTNCNASWPEAEFIRIYKEWRKDIADKRMRDYQWEERRDD